MNCQYYGNSKYHLVAHTTRKAYARAHSILRCFMSGHRLSNINASISLHSTFTRIKFVSMITISKKCLIKSLENVRRWFTKRMSGLYNLTYHHLPRPRES
jgi:hypothetical protein